MKDQKFKTKDGPVNHYLSKGTHWVSYLKEQS